MIEPEFEVFDRSVRSFVRDGSGEDSLIFPGKVGGPIPEAPKQFTTVKMVWQRRDGHSWTQGDDTYESTHVLYSIDWFRKGAYDAARTFRVWSTSDNGILSACAHGLTIVRPGDIRQFDTIVSEEWEERAQMDLLLGLLQKLTRSTEYIDTACGTIIDTDGHTANVDGVIK